MMWIRHGYKKKDNQYLEINYIFKTEFIYIYIYISLFTNYNNTINFKMSFEFI